MSSAKLQKMLSYAEARRKVIEITAALRREHQRQNLPPSARNAYTLARAQGRVLAPACCR